MKRPVRIPHGSSQILVRCFIGFPDFCRHHFLHLPCWAKCYLDRFSRVLENLATTGNVLQRLVAKRHALLVPCIDEPEKGKSEPRVEVLPTDLDFFCFLYLVSWGFGWLLTLEFRGFVESTCQPSLGNPVEEIDLSCEHMGRAEHGDSER